MIPECAHESAWRNGYRLARWIEGTERARSRLALNAPSSANEERRARQDAHAITTAESHERRVRQLARARARAELKRAGCRWGNCMAHAPSSRIGERL